MLYWIVGGVGAVLIIALGIFLSGWDAKRHSAPQEQPNKKDK